MIAHHHVAPPFANVASTAFSGWRRWGLALAVSLALHAALLWGLRGMPPQTPPTSVAPDRSVHWLAATLLPTPPTQAKTQSTTQPPTKPTAQLKTEPITLSLIHI